MTPYEPSMKGIRPVRNPATGELVDMDALIKAEARAIRRADARNHGGA